MGRWGDVGSGLCERGINRDTDSVLSRMLSISSSLHGRLELLVSRNTPTMISSKHVLGNVEP